MAAVSTKMITLVTGGNAGIGYHICEKLAREHPDFHVLMGCRDTSKGEAAVASMGAPENVNPIQLDITDDESISNCFRAVEQEFGRLDCLINNAGISGSLLPLDINPREKWSQIYQVNAVSAGVLTEKMVTLLEKSHSPKVIFITSLLGSIGSMADSRGPPLDYLPYMSSKAAMNHISVWYARKYPTWKVNTCCPGLAATDLSGQPLREEIHPRHGAINAVRLATEVDGQTATFTNKEGPIPW